MGRGEKTRKTNQLSFKKIITFDVCMASCDIRLLFSFTACSVLLKVWVRNPCDGFKFSMCLEMRTQTGNINVVVEASFL